MAIYLDANTMFGWSPRASLSAGVLRIVAANEVKQVIYVPDVAFDEASWKYRRRLEEVVRTYRGQVGDIDGMSGAAAIDPEALFKEWRTWAKTFLKVLESTPASAAEGLRREITRQPPAGQTANLEIYGDRD